MTLKTYLDSGIKEDLKPYKRGVKSKKRMTKKKGVVPTTKKGKAMVAKLGRTKKTGGFAKIAAKATKEYGSKESGKRVAGKIFWNMAKKRGGK